MSQRFYVETLGCPKNQVDSDKLIGNLLADGLLQTAEPEDASVGASRRGWRGVGSLTR